MMTIELRKKLIDKIQETKDDRILEEAYRLLELETDDIEVYKLNDDQKNAIGEARQQIKNGEFLTEEKANKEIDEWLKK
jgi:predicted transcriptional regulator